MTIMLLDMRSDWWYTLNYPIVASTIIYPYLVAKTVSLPASSQHDICRCEVKSCGVTKDFLWSYAQRECELRQGIENKLITK